MPRPYLAPPAPVHLGRYKISQDAIPMPCEEDAVDVPNIYDGKGLTFPVQEGQSPKYLDKGNLQNGFLDWEECWDEEREKKIKSIIQELRRAEFEEQSKQYDEWSGVFKKPVVETALESSLAVPSPSDFDTLANDWIDSFGNHAWTEPTKLVTPTVVMVTGTTTNSGVPLFEDHLLRDPVVESSVAPEMLFPEVGFAFETHNEVKSSPPLGPTIFSVAAIEPTKPVDDPIECESLEELMAKLVTKPSPQPLIPLQPQQPLQPTPQPAIKDEFIPTVCEEFDEMEDEKKLEAVAAKREYTKRKKKPKEKNLSDEKIALLGIEEFNYVLSRLPREHQLILKELRRRRQNKRAAQICRERKSKKINEHSVTVKDLESEKNRLVEEITEYDTELFALKRKFENLKRQYGVECLLLFP